MGLTCKGLCLPPPFSILNSSFAPPFFFFLIDLRLPKILAESERKTFNLAEDIHSFYK